MSKCITCSYALYDGMCLAKGKFTVLDADACETYAPIMEHELAELRRENEKLRVLVRDMWRDGMCECDERGACAECEYHFPDRMRELGIEVD